MSVWVEGRRYRTCGDKEIGSDTDYFTTRLTVVMELGDFLQCHWCMLRWCWTSQQLQAES